MGLVYAGIDEAGYGPLLGPLCVALSVVRVADWTEGEPAPDLWARLPEVFCRRPGGDAKPGRTPRSRRDQFTPLAIDDSKKLKLANSSVRHDPLTHLERGVLTLLACQDQGLTSTLALNLTSPNPDPAESSGPDFDQSWLSESGFLRHLGAIGSGPDFEGSVSHAPSSPPQFLPPPWCTPCRDRMLKFPRQCSSGEVAIWSNIVRPALDGAGVAIGPIRCRAMHEAEFNQRVEAAGTKAAATEAALGQHLQAIWDHLCPPAVQRGDSVRVVCDQQGGRTQYRATLARLLGASAQARHVEILEESHRSSRYLVSDEPQADAGDATRPPRRMVIAFMPEAESAHLPVALASMTAKLTRELFMARFNQYWQARVPELKPTAGYRNDGWRWLSELGAAATPEERLLMIRRA